MATEINLTPNKTYATAENARKAITKLPRFAEDTNLRYLMMQTPEGRFYPVFLGERAIQAGVHFHFCVAG